MIRRLVCLLVASLLAYGGLHQIDQHYLSGIESVVASGDPHSIWRFGATFMMTAALWIVLAVAALAAFSIAILLIKPVPGKRSIHATPLARRRKVPGAGLR